jgi:Tfp pilus assembly protein PilN
MQGAWRNKMKDINLMPEEVKAAAAPKSEFLKAGGIPKKAVAVLIVVLVFAIASVITPRIYVGSLERHTALIKAEIESDRYDEIKKVNSDLAAIQATVTVKKEVINKINSSQPQITDILNYVQQAVPQGITIQGFEYGDKKMSISGYTKDSTAVAEYISNLTRLSAFADYTANATFSFGKANAGDKFKLDFSQTAQGE